MAARLTSFFSRARITQLAFYSSSTLSLGAAGFYRYHSTQPTASVLASSNAALSTSPTEGPASAHRVYSRMTIPSGSASAIECPPDLQDLRHVLVTVQGEGEVVFHGEEKARANSTVVFGEDSMVRKPLRLGGSVGIPCSKWNAIVNKHATKDLVLVITSIPNN